MKQSIFLVALAATLGIFWAPKEALGQNKDILALQRDLYSVGDKVDKFQTNQAQRMEELGTLLKQAMEANAKLSAEMQALQATINRNQAEQQNRMFEPLASMKTSVGELGESVAELKAKLDTMGTRQGKMESSLTRVDGVVNLLYTEAKNPPAAVVPAAPTGPTPEQAATLLFGTARRSLLTGDAATAQKQFIEVLTNYPTTPEAPMAAYEVGLLYEARDQYEDALEAFDRVLEQFGENPMWKDAQFHKADMLANLGKRSEAAGEFNRFALKYPADSRADVAMSRAKELRAPAPAGGKAKAPAGNSKKGKSK
ncbi:MAG: tetratricopeptide repeat protein [Acidobacteriota bacterium]